MPSTDGTTDGSVLVSSARQLELPCDPAYLDSFEFQRADHTIHPTSGNGEVREWMGIRIDALLERTGDPEAEETTHLVVTGDDGYRVCIPVADTGDALLAVSHPDDGDEEFLPRIVGTDIEAIGSVREVLRIEAVILSRSEAATQPERLTDVDIRAQRPPIVSRRGWR